MGLFYESYGGDGVSCKEFQERKVVCFIVNSSKLQARRNLIWGKRIELYKSPGHDTEKNRYTIAIISSSVFVSLLVFLANDYIDDHPHDDDYRFYLNPQLLPSEKLQLEFLHRLNIPCKQ